MTALQQLVKGIEASLELDTPEEITKSIAGIAESVCPRWKELVQAVPVVEGESKYARNLLYKDEQERFTIIVMSWRPGQGTPLHDHDGKWGVEITCRGNIECTDYDVSKCPQTGNWKCEPGEVCVQNPGEVGTILPDEGYHTMVNTSSEPAITIHIYENELSQCTIFTPSEDQQTFLKDTLELGYDNE